MGNRLRAGISGCSQPTRSTQPCIPPGSLNRVPASAGVRSGMSPLPGGLCDLIWHVSSRSGVATLRTAIHLLLTYLLTKLLVCCSVCDKSIRYDTKYCRSWRWRTRLISAWPINAQCNWVDLCCEQVLSMSCLNSVFIEYIEPINCRLRVPAVHCNCNH